MTSLYCSLPLNSIRLLRFLDDTGLSCSLSVHSLEDAPPYIALSYTWGKATYQKGRAPDQEYSISLNERKVLVQQNLYDALTHLGKRVRRQRDGDHAFWVDYLCINQEDINELSVQVACMKTIYEKSAKIFAWLGLPYDEEEVQLAVRLMRSFNEWLHTGLIKHNDDIVTVLREVNTETVGFPAIKHSDNWKAWMGLSEMMNNNYWKRTWIYQEATTPGQILFYCGDEHFDDIYLSAAATFGACFSKFVEFEPHFRESLGTGSNMHRLNKARIRREEGYKQDLVNLVLAVRSTDCTDYRDKVFASLGHAVDVTVDEMMPDYHKDVVTVYGEVVRFCFAKKRETALQVLEHVHMPAEEASNKFLSKVFDPVWPSWIPDWRQHISMPSLYSHSNDIPLSVPQPGSLLEANFDGQILAVKGYLLNGVIITQLTSICEDSEKIFETVKGWHTVITEVDNSEQTDVSVRRSLVADATRVEVDKRGAEQHMRGYCADWETIRFRGNDMFSRVSNVCLGRRMGRTSKGHIGIFPAATQINDVVSVFFGGNLLYVLRPVSGYENYYKFVGGCYVDGLMDGAATEYATTPQMLHLV